MMNQTTEHLIQTSRVRRRAGLALILLVALSMPAPADAVDRIVAIGDVHGAYDELVLILKKTGLVDDELRWSGGEAVLVQTGDLLDRGAQVREVVDLMMRLEAEAAEAGGRVEVLLGNHEALNLLGVFRDVHPGAFESYATEESEKRRKLEWKKLKRFVIQTSRQAGVTPPNLGSHIQQQWMDEHPLGWFEYRDAFLGDGTYGQWFRRRAVGFRFGDLLFVHGGLSLDMTERSPDAATARVHDELRRFGEAQDWLVDEGLALPDAGLDEVMMVVKAVVEAGPETGIERFETAERLTDISDWYLISPDGPLWYRGMVYGEEDEIRDDVMSLFDADGIAYMAVAHTPQVEGTIQTRFDSRLFLIDTGLNPGHFDAGQPSALEFSGSQIRAVYLDSDDVLVKAETPLAVWAETPGAVGSTAAARRPIYQWLDVTENPSPYQSDDAIEWILRNAEIVSSEAITTGTTRPYKLVLDHDGAQIHAAFRSVDRKVRRARGQDLGVAAKRLKDRGVHEVAAYEVDRLLGLGRVPVAVEREFDGRGGSVQAWVEKCIREIDRREDNLTPPDLAYWARQLVVMKVFDAIIGNFDRNQGNMLIDDSWRLWLIDHTRAFHINPEVTGIDKLTRCDRTLLEGLRGIDADEARARLSDLIGDDETEALLSRCEQLVKHFDALIAERGEIQVLFDLRTDEGASPVDDLPELLEIPALTPFVGIFD